jgi:hypothetical protein
VLRRSSLRAYEIPNPCTRVPEKGIADKRNHRNCSQFHSSLFGIECAPVVLESNLKKDLTHLGPAPRE